jgi:hypothetical protein
MSNYTSTWFLSLPREERKSILVELHELRRRGNTTIIPLLQALEEDHHSLPVGS